MQHFQHTKDFHPFFEYSSDIINRNEDKTYYNMDLDLFEKFLTGK